MWNWRKFSSSQSDELNWKRSATMTIIMIGLILVASILMMRHINEAETERCFERLYREARDIASFIELNANNDREQLELLANVIAQNDDFNSPQLWQLLRSFDRLGMMSYVELLLPGNKVITRDGTIVDATGQLSFEQEVAHGAHISDRENDLLEPKSYVVRHYVPVIKNDEVVAMLYGLIMIEKMPDIINITPYGGKGALYILDGPTGDLFLDTWHPSSVVNMYALGSRPMAPGYDDKILKRGLITGESNYVVFVSRTIGEYLYFYYTPLKINEWRIALSVPESVVFASSILIERILNIFLAFELSCFALYLIWMFRDFRKVTSAKQKRLDTIKNIQKVEHYLFNAHEKKENLFMAIEELGSIMNCQRISFWVTESGISQYYRWVKGEPAVEGAKDSLAPPVKLLQHFRAGHDFYETYDPAEIAQDHPAAAQTHIKSILAVPVMDVVSGHMSGILVIANGPKDPLNYTLMKAMSFSFGMYCNNVKNRADLQEQGDRDSLTGMHNRNRYERDLNKIFTEHQAALTCIYIDVNGLREMNNIKGHDLGDKMLSTVAQGISQYFNTDYMYRVGGDEFVLFAPGTNEQDFLERSAALAKELEVNDYHISVGIESQHNVPSISQLIKAAEKKMYDQKRAFYATRERRQMHVA